MAREYLGHIPDLKAGWELVDTFSHPAAGEWGIYRQEQAHSADWANYKVVATAPVESKANYWFAYNAATKALGFGRDLNLMKNARRPLYDAVTRLLEA